MVPFKEDEKQFVRDTLIKARSMGLNCILQVKSEYQNRFTTVSTNESNDIDKIFEIKSQYTDEIDPATRPIFQDLLDFARSTKTDANGWTALFNETNDTEDGRWYMKVDKLNNEIQLHRRESSVVKYISQLKLYYPDDDYLAIIRCWKDKDDNRSYPVKFAALNASIKAVSDETWEEWLGGYGLLVRDVILDILELTNMKN